MTNTNLYSHRNLETQLNDRDKMIYENIKRFLEWRDDAEDFGFNRDIWLTSGGFDPLHVGHLRSLQETVYLANNKCRYPSKRTGLVTVLVNCDNFLKAKKGYVFMSLEDRMEIIASIRGIDAVIPWFYMDGDFTVVKAIDQLRPKFFTKGGDRTDKTNIPEWEICQQRDCTIITGVGGKKIRSSSKLVEEADRFNLEAVELMGWADGYTKGKDGQ
jgi:cytidyltransferase-like protein